MSTQDITEDHYILQNMSQKSVGIMALVLLLLSVNFKVQNYVHNGKDSMHHLI